MLPGLELSSALGTTPIWPSCCVHANRLTPQGWSEGFCSSLMSGYFCPPGLWQSSGRLWAASGNGVTAENNLSKKGGLLYWAVAEGSGVAQLEWMERKTTLLFGSTVHFSENQMQCSSCCTRGLCTSCRIHLCLPQELNSDSVPSIY